MISRWQVFAIFLCCAAGYQKLVMPNHIHWFQFLYYFSSFWGLFGSHTTSFLLAGASCRPDAQSALSCQQMMSLLCTLSAASNLPAWHSLSCGLVAS